jgi:hypothetical protein
MTTYCKARTKDNQGCLHPARSNGYCAVHGGVKGAYLLPLRDRSLEEEDVWDERLFDGKCPHCGSKNWTEYDWVYSQEIGDEMRVGIDCDNCGYWSDGWRAGVVER